MKKYYLTITLALLQSLSFAQKDVVSLTISQEGFGAKNKLRIYIDNKQIELTPKESLLYQGKFPIDKILSGNVRMPNGRYGDFWLEPGEAKLIIKKTGFPASMKVEGSETNEIYRELKYTKKSKVVEQRILEKPTHLGTLNYLAKYYERHDCDFLNQLFMGYSPKVQSKLPNLASYLKTANTEKINEGTQLYDFQARTQSGRSINTADYRGKFLLLDFASTGCGPCWQGYPDMIKTVTQYEELEVLTFNEDNNKKGWNRLAKIHDLDIPWPVLWDSEEKLETFNIYAIDGWPNFFLISPEGEVLERWFGAGKGRLKKALKRHLN